MVKLDIWTGSLFTIFIFFCGTYIYTTCRFFLSSIGDRRHKGKTPLTLPYWFPIIGSAIPMSTNGHEFYESTMQAFAPVKRSHGNIIGARLGPMFVYFVAGAKNIQTIFRNSKSLTTRTLVLRIYGNVIGVPRGDMKIFEYDDSESMTTPLTQIPEEKRIWQHRHHAIVHSLKNTEALNILTRVFTREIMELANQQHLGEWQTGPFKQNPDLAKDFWEFMRGFMVLFFGIPRLIAPKPYAARDRLIQACTKHLRDIESRYDGIIAANAEWDEDLGSRVNRDLDKVMKDVGISPEGRGAMMGGFMIGINGNAIPVGCWILIESIRTPGLLEALREEIMTAVSIDEDNKESLILDIATLLSLPLLSSVYTETLRLRISTTPTRQLRNDLLVGGYVLKAGNHVMVPSWLAHTESQWSTPEHPASEFWAERFLGKTDADGNVGEPPKSTQAGTFFPFGGGTSMCPGRFFAKQEILSGVAIMIAKFEIEFVENVHHDGTPSKRGPDADINNAGSGALLPDSDLKVRLRRRI
ncbi:cytochrome P450 [Amylocarpus encephaloides]|uniref:Cytochrome P450 n=1 Tax=Amylocarpus encephaloides TaxID=45428 RepID=A0A9P7YKB9_9HELO|nr:cytochrome P450 [Amylocarpus encephaloides]